MPRRPTSAGYAADTSVPVDRSKQQIEQLLTQHGAEGFHTGWHAATADTPGWDAISFQWKGRSITFKLARPIPKAYSARNNQIQEQKNRQRWRILFLVIKAKLEAVRAGVSIFEEEFMAFIVTPGGATVGEVLLPMIKTESGMFRKALPAAEGTVEEDR